MSNIIPCPFCGKKHGREAKLASELGPDRVWRGYYGESKISVGCGCGAYGPAADTVEAAIAAWNAAAAPEMYEALKESEKILNEVNELINEGIIVFEEDTTIQDEVQDEIIAAGKLSLAALAKVDGGKEHDFDDRATKEIGN